MSFLKSLITVINPIAGALVNQSEKEKALSRDAQNALVEVRKKFPGPDKCVLGTELLPYYTGNGTWNYSTPCGSPQTYIPAAIEEMKKTLSDWHIPRSQAGSRGDTPYIDAYNLVINEYSDYFNAHYLTPAPTDTAGAGSTDHATNGTPGAGTTTNNLVAPAIPAKKNNTKLILIVAGIGVLVIATAIIIKKRMKPAA